MGRSSSEESLKRHLQQMGDYDFEHFVADLWERQGWNTEVEQQSNDAGVDVRAIKSSPFHQKQLIQAKRYSQSTTVGGPDIQQYASLKQQEQAVDSAVIVTTSSFTRPAKKRADDLNVKLVDGDDLVSLIDEFDAHDIVDSYLNASRRDVTTTNDGSLTEADTPDDQIEVLDVPFLTVTHEKGTTPDSANLSKTWRYYLIFAGIVVQLSSLVTLSLELIAIGFIMLPLAIASDAKNVGVISWKDRGWWVSVIGAAVPVIGIVPTVLYLLSRRGMLMDIRPDEKPLAETGSRDEELFEEMRSDIRGEPWKWDRVDEYPFNKYHQATETIKQLKRERRHDEVEELLLWCIDFTEAEARADQPVPDTPAPAYYRHLAIVYRKEERCEDEVAILERYMNVCEELRADPDDDLVDRLDHARELDRNN